LLVPVAETGINGLYKPGLKAFFPPVSREELIVSSFDNSGRRFWWLQPVVFPLKLRGFFQIKRIGVPVC
jgi:hypothetical protein